MVAASLLSVGGGVGGTILYAQWDPKFRAAVEKNVPYSDSVFGLVLGPAPQDAGHPIRKQVSNSTDGELRRSKPVCGSSPCAMLILTSQTCI